MRRNRRKSDKFKVLTGRTMNLASIFALLVAMIVVNQVAQAKCSQTQKSIGEKEKLLARLESERVMESSRWERMLTSDNLERALLKHGLDMKCPRDEMIIRMDASGTPRLGQRSVELAMNRRDGTAVAANRNRRRR